MKASIEIPDELYRQVKAKSALEGRAIREVTIELHQAWIAHDLSVDQPLSLEQWIEEWLRLGEETMRNAPPGPTAREILEEDRNRLERR